VEALDYIEKLFYIERLNFCLFVIPLTVPEGGGNATDRVKDNLQSRIFRLRTGRRQGKDC
jgi:hypothetical protein